MISDVVAVTGMGIIGGILTLLIKFWLNRLDKKMSKVNEKVDIVDGKVDTVEKNTNGLVKHLIESKDAEIKTTGELQKEIGKSEATAEAKIEIDKLNKDSNPEK